MAKDEIEKIFEEAARLDEDEAWAKKRAVYGKRFNASKFYELSAFWPNFWAWFWFLMPPIIITVLLANSSH